MRKLYTLFAAVVLTLSVYAAPGDPDLPYCDAADTIEYKDWICPVTENWSLVHDDIIHHIISPTQDTLVVDTVKTQDGICDSLIIKWQITLLPKYVMYMDPIYIPVGQMSMIWEHDGQEHKGGDVVADSMMSMDGCDSIQIYQFIKETPSGHCGGEGDGSNLEWYISEDSVLHISGQGAMANYYEYAETAPWDAYRDVIKEVIFPDNITHIGDEAFKKCSVLQSVSIPAKVSSIGSATFMDCSSLTYVNTPDLVAWCAIQFADTASNPLCMAHTLHVNGTPIRHLIIPESVTTIQRSAFYHSDIKKATLHAMVDTIYCGAFDNCEHLDTMICYAPVPPQLPCGAPGWLSERTILCVPYASMEAYQAIYGYAFAFKLIMGFSDVKETTATTATIMWIPDPAVTLYTIDVYQATTPVAHYEVDGSGHVLSSSLPAIYRMRKDTTTGSDDYFVLTIADLNAGTDYNYVITGTDNQNVPIYHEEGSFTTTEDQQAIFDPIADDPNKVTKILRNNQIFILRGDKVYTITGHEVNLLMK